jgi:hypothetical protein
VLRAVTRLMNPWLEEEDHIEDTRGSNAAASCEYIERNTLAEEQVAGLSADSRNVLYGFELITLCNMPFDSVGQEEIRR